jgi:mannose-6-phosphate isomerase-like protein (cupin superfamily)
MQLVFIVSVVYLDIMSCGRRRHYRVGPRTREAPVFRMIVTGHTHDRGAHIASEHRVSPTLPALYRGNALYRAWGSDDIPTAPNNGTVAPYRSFYPDTRGALRVIYATILPRHELRPTPVDPSAAISELDTLLPGMADVVTDPNGMHATPTIDFVCVLSGALTLELAGGERTHLAAGDLVVQNGTAHAFHNVGDQPATFFAVLVGCASEVSGD